MKVWRICRKRHALHPFNGEGGLHVSGRWHPLGTPMAYASTSLSLAALEVFVHLDPATAPDDLVSIAAEIPLNEAQVANERLLLMQKLPADWRRIGHPALQEIGAKWIASGASLALHVPSAVVDGEWNVLINPAHPDAGKIKPEKAKPFQFDERMFKR